MNSTFIDFLDDILSVFVDDLLICINEERKHSEHIANVLQQLCETNLGLLLRKCDFYMTNINTS